MTTLGRVVICERAQFFFCGAALALLCGQAFAADAKSEELWSLHPIARALPPLPNGAPNPIDAFVQAGLRAEGLTPAPPADRRTLLRRVSYDLTGLPPTLDEIRDFERDRLPDAYERRVDRLLASPRHGERWARHWLDVARFAETNGYERDAPKPHAWKYRDWVIRSLNADKPFDQFVLEQIAGDELPDGNEETVTGTGFLRLGTWDDEPNDALDYKYERLEDMVHASSTAFLALTVKCARCHDHKFDPIPQRDYYRIAAAFWAGFIEPRGRELMGGPSDAELGFQVLGWTDRGREIPPLNLLKKGDPRQPEGEIAPGFLSAITKLDRPVPPSQNEARTSGRRLALARWIVDAENPLTARVAANRIWQHHFGRGLVASADNFGVKGDRPSHPELLDWLAHELIDSGWSQKHLHRRIVTSQTYRQASVHPDENAFATRDSGNRFLWRANRRRLEAEALRDSLLVASEELSLRLGGPSVAPEIAPDALEGLSQKDKAWQASPEAEQRRRSVYLFAKRSLLLPLLTVFDFADTTLPCARRESSIVPTQALALLNNAFAHRKSEAMAARVERECGPRAQPCIVRAFELAFGRAPDREESEAARRHIEVQERRFRERAVDGATRDPRRDALASLCHVLLNSNEFLFVD